MAKQAVNRPIKFRVWDDAKKIWCSVKEQAEIFEMVGFNDPEGRMIWVQFTGLFDKNGKEIYEGDMLQSKDTVVIWNEKEGMFGITTGQYSLGNYVGLEIIGNIYENSELLNG